MENDVFYLQGREIRQLTFAPELGGEISPFLHRPLFTGFSELQLFMLETFRRLELFDIPEPEDLNRVSLDLRL